MTKNNHDNLQQHSLPTLAVAAIGVVFGDIGTSPLYALKEAFSPAHGIALTDDAILGVISLLFWAIIAVAIVAYYGTESFVRRPRTQLAVAGAV